MCAQRCSTYSSKGFLQSLGVSVPTVSIETLSLFTRVEDDNTGAQIDVAIDFGGSFMSDGNTPTEATKMRGLMTSYLKDFYEEGNKTFQHQILILELVICNSNKICVLNHRC